MSGHGAGQRDVVGYRAAEQRSGLVALWSGAEGERGMGRRTEGASSKGVNFAVVCQGQRDKGSMKASRLCLGNGLYKTFIAQVYPCCMLNL